MLTRFYNSLTRATAQNVSPAVDVAPHELKKDNNYVSIVISIHCHVSRTSQDALCHGDLIIAIHPTWRPYNKS